MKSQSAAKHRPKSGHVPPTTLTDYGREEWRRLASLAISAGTLTATTARSFELLVETLATERAARELVAAAGLTVATGRGGTLKAHPATRSMEQARVQAAVLLRLFRLAPGKAPPPPPEPRTNGIWAGVI